jgi:hypothetical protein
MMINPFETIGKTITKIQAIQKAHQTLLNDPEFVKMEKPKWYNAVVGDGNLELAEKFKAHFGENGSSAGLYAEIMCGPTPSKGCDKCSFNYILRGHAEKRCNFYGECTPFKGTR